jgi:hypothetical protein
MSPGQLHEVILSCPNPLLSEVRHIIRKAISVEGIQDHLEFSLRPWAHGLDGNMAMMQVTSEVTTDWVVFLDDNGLDYMASGIRELLLNPMSILLPTGPRGILSVPNNISCLEPSEVPQRASFLIPPFVVPYSLVKDNLFASTGLDVWADLGERISQDRLDGTGGIVMGVDVTSDWCYFFRSQVTSRNHSVLIPNFKVEPDALKSTKGAISIHQNTSTEEKVGTFALLFPSLRVMRLFSPVVCRLQASGHRISVLLYGNEGQAEHSMDSEELQSKGCRINYDTLSPDNVFPEEQPTSALSFVLDWLDGFDKWPEVVVALNGQDSLSGLATVLAHGHSVRPSLILIPRSDLPYCEWMGSLSTEEWKSQYFFPFLLPVHWS